MEWISPKQQPIPYNRDVRVKLKYGVEAYAYRSDEDYPMLWCFTRYGNYTTAIVDVAGWMLLPEPPKEDSE